MAAPAIYCRQLAPQRLSARGRLLALVVALGALTPLVVAARLTPAVEGHGTHEQLGMIACQFLRNTGIPCLSCGMTTSFARFAHGQWLGSLWTQPMGFVLALLCGTGFWTGLYLALSGRPAHRLLRLIPLRWGLLPLLFVAVAAWGWKILIHLKGWE